MTWAPKPLRPTLNEGIFAFYKPDILVKSESDLERQRRLDGSPSTRGNITGIKPPGRNAELVLKGVGEEFASEYEIPMTDEDRMRKAMETVKEYVNARGFMG